MRSCYPIAHHDIATDIPFGRYKTIRTGYFAWITAFLGYVLNWIVITFLFAAGYKSLMDWVLACVITIIGIPASWIFWYKALYHSQMTDKVFHYAQFFFHGALHMGWASWTIVSPPVWLGVSLCSAYKHFAY
jgi:hypothetical protein